MLARKVFASVSLLICLSGSAAAMELRQESVPLQSPYLHKAGWDQSSLDAQMQGAVHLRAKIQKLEKENEQLRNSLSKQRAIGRGTSSGTKDPRIQALVEENLRLSELVGKSGSHKAVSVDVCAQKIQDLEAENLRMQDSLGKVAAQTALKYERSLAHYKQENTRLEAEKSLLSSEQISLSSSSSLSLQSVAKLQIELEQLQENNKALSLSLGQAKTVSVSPSSSQGEVRSLQEQNQSLRDTIRAQTNTLVSTNNASQTAERLLAENTNLYRKLDMAKKANDSNGKSAKEYYAQVQMLKSEVTKRDTYIKKLQNFRDSENKSNQKYVSREPTVSKSTPQDRLVTLEDRNKSLESALNKERKSAIAYRTKIRQYQEQLATVDDSQSQGARHTLTTLQLENQELKARIELLSEPSYSLDSSDLLGENPVPRSQ